MSDGGLRQYVRAVCDAIKKNPNSRSWHQYAGPQGARKFASEMGYGIADFLTTKRLSVNKWGDEVDKVRRCLYGRNPPISAGEWFAYVEDGYLRAHSRWG